MIGQATVDLSRRELIAEVRRYLAAVDAFRAEGHEPRWRPERPVVDDEAVPRRRIALRTPPIP